MIPVFCFILCFNKNKYLMTKLGKFCLFTPIKVSIISVLLSVLISTLIIEMNRPSNYPQHGCDMSGILYVLIIFMNLLASLLSYTIAFNFYKIVRDNFVLSLMSFYALPVLVAFYLFKGDSTIFFTAIISLPFLIPQTYYFVRFRKRLKSGDILEDHYID